MEINFYVNKGQRFSLKILVLCWLFQQWQELQDSLTHFIDGKTELQRGQVTYLTTGPGRKTLSLNIHPTTIIPRRFPKPMKVVIGYKRSIIILSIQFPELSSQYLEGQQSVLSSSKINCTHWRHLSSNSTLLYLYLHINIFLFTLCIVILHLLCSFRAFSSLVLYTCMPTCVHAHTHTDPLQTLALLFMSCLHLCHWVFGLYLVTMWCVCSYTQMFWVSSLRDNPCL